MLGSSLSGTVAVFFPMNPNMMIDCSKVRPQLGWGFKLERVDASLRGKTARGKRSVVALTPWLLFMSVCNRSNVTQACLNKLASEILLCAYMCDIAIARTKLNACHDPILKPAYRYIYISTSMQTSLSSDHPLNLISTHDLKFVASSTRFTLLPLSSGKFSHSSARFESSTSLSDSFVHPCFCLVPGQALFTAFGLSVAFSIFLVVALSLAARQLRL